MPTKETAGAAMSALGGKSGAPSLGSLLRVWHSKHANPDTNRLSRDRCTHPDPDRGFSLRRKPNLLPSPRAVGVRPCSSCCASPPTCGIAARANSASVSVYDEPALRPGRAALRRSADQIPNLTWTGGTSRRVTCNPRIGENSQYEGETPDRRALWSTTRLHGPGTWAAPSTCGGRGAARPAAAPSGPTQPVVSSARDAGAHAVLDGQIEGSVGGDHCAPAVLPSAGP